MTVQQQLDGLGDHLVYVEDVPGYLQTQSGRGLQNLAKRFEYPESRSTEKNQLLKTNIWRTDV
ncbi:Uu.00g066860.m01.CDS01 [Anthostomella pinea]|uniref:Uu.00g066860.m01.CDS01 n=1 Tax=Anthostomella pinea TaxID=933095 RepID=A0AAI8YNF7_9PEZI|nr:Uu.00g066860.m01.CDS01 [Anthostomella pinea]